MTNPHLPIVVLLNGPPGSGKSTIAGELVHRLKNKPHGASTFVVHQDSFAGPMKHMVATMFAEKYAGMDKDAPRTELRGGTVWQMMISLSEDFMKPRYGREVWGNMLVERVLKAAGQGKESMRPPPDFVVVDDLGFVEEVGALQLYDIPNVVVRVTRPGYDFTIDSRSYVPEFDYLFDNAQDIPFLHSTCDELVSALMGMVQS